MFDPRQAASMHFGHAALIEPWEWTMSDSAIKQDILDELEFEPRLTQRRWVWPCTTAS
jgi:hypothetical protein